jgi:hypothetical protein
MMFVSCVSSVRDRATTLPVTVQKILIRYADVLLMYAKARNEANGPDANVYSAINQVRVCVHMPLVPEGLTQGELENLEQNPGYTN